MTVNEHLWDFPHAMTLKVMGASDSPLEQAVVAILCEHVADFDPNLHVHLQASTKGNFISVNARVVMRDRDQVATIYAALNACPHVKVVF
jgi:uncharacterized protein